MNATLTIMRKELRDATRSRWLVMYAVAFALIALAFGVVQEQGDVGAQGFNRTTASIINLCILLVPLLALVIGAGSIAGERDRGTMTTLLSQPLTPTELLIGKYLGLTIAAWIAVALGFGAAGMLLALVSPVTDFGHYLLFIVLSGALASAMLSIGMLISVLSDGRAKALAISVLAWFGFVLFYDLAAMGVALSLTSSGESLLVAAVANPVESVRILAILSLEPDLNVLGPLGAYLKTQFGTAGSSMLLSLAVLFWAAVPMTAATFVFRKQDV